MSNESGCVVSEKQTIYIYTMLLVRPYDDALTSSHLQITLSAVIMNYGSLRDKYGRRVLVSLMCFILPQQLAEKGYSLPALWRPTLLWCFRFTAFIRFYF